MEKKTKARTYCGPETAGADLFVTLPAQVNIVTENESADRGFGKSTVVKINWDMVNWLRETTIARKECGVLSFVKIVWHLKPTHRKHANTGKMAVEMADLIEHNSRHHCRGFPRNGLSIGFEAKKSWIRVKLSYLIVQNTDPCKGWWLIDKHIPCCTDVLDIKMKYIKFIVQKAVIWTKENKIIIYQDENDYPHVFSSFSDEELWLSQSQLLRFIAQHNKMSLTYCEYFSDKDWGGNHKKFLLVQTEGYPTRKNVTSHVITWIWYLLRLSHFRVSATRFRRWANSNNCMGIITIKVICMDDETDWSKWKSSFSWTLQRICDIRVFGT